MAGHEFQRGPATPVKSVIKWEYSIKKCGDCPLIDIIYDDTEWIEFPEQFSSNMELSYTTTKDLIETNTIFVEPIDNGIHDLAWMFAKTFGHARPLRLLINIAGMTVSNHATGERRYIRRRERLAHASIDALLAYEVGVQIERAKKFTEIKQT